MFRLTVHRVYEITPGPLPRQRGHLRVLITKDISWIFLRRISATTRETGSFRLEGFPGTKLATFSGTHLERCGHRELLMAFYFTFTDVIQDAADILPERTCCLISLAVPGLRSDVYLCEGRCLPGRQKDLLQRIVR